MKIGLPRANSIVQRPPAMDSYYERSDAMERFLSALRTFWAIVETNYRRLLLGIFLGLAIGVAYLIFRTPVYEATSSLLVRTDNSRIVPIDDASVGLRGQADIQGFATEIQFLTSREVGVRVVQKLNLTEHPLFSDSPRRGVGDARTSVSWLNPGRWPELIYRAVTGLRGTSPDSAQVAIPPSDAARRVVPDSRLVFTLDRYFAGISVEPIRGSRIMKIKFRSSDPIIAAMVVNAAADAYLEAELELRSAANRNATVGLNSQLEALRSRLVASESELAGFREQHNLPVFGSGNLQPLQIQITDLSRQVLSASIATSEAQERVDTTRLAGSEGRQSAALTSASPAIERARQKMAAAEQDFKATDSRYGKEHPTYQAALSQLESVRSALRQEVGAETTRLDQALQSAKREEEALRAARLALIESEKQAGRFNNERAYLEQNVEINRQLYQTFLSRAREVGAANDVQAPSANILDRAMAPGDPIGPGRSFVLAFFLFGGALIGFLWAYLRHYLERTIRTSEQVEHDFGHFVLAALPELPPELNRSRGKLIRSAPSLAYCEGIRVVAATIEFERSEDDVQSIAITSADGGPGRTTFVTNLGVALSESRRVLIIDADTSGGNLDRIMGIRRAKPGLLDVLAYGISASDAIHRARRGHLSVMTIGGEGGGAAASAKLTRLRRLVHDMEQQFDIVLINAPPMNFSADGLIVSGACRESLIVVESKATSSSAVHKAVSRLSRVRAKLLGIVLDGCPVESSAKNVSGYESTNQVSIISEAAA